MFMNDRPTFEAALLMAGTETRQILGAYHPFIAEVLGASSEVLHDYGEGPGSSIDDPTTGGGGTAPREPTLPPEPPDPTEPKIIDKCPEVVSDEDKKECATLCAGHADEEGNPQCATLCFYAPQMDGSCELATLCGSCGEQPNSYTGLTP